MEALLDAIEEDKQVAALVELKARFDEESNIEWARAMERSGVHVVYGLVGLKIHRKIALVASRCFWKNSTVMLWICSMPIERGLLGSRSSKS